MIACFYCKCFDSTQGRVFSERSVKTQSIFLQSKVEFK